MTAEEERRLRAELLLEIEETEGKIELAHGRLRDWARTKLAHLDMALQTGSIEPRDLEILRAAPELIPAAQELMALKSRLIELHERRRRSRGG